jgi:ribonuclease-3
MFFAELSILEQRLGYTFKKKTYAIKALTHTSVQRRDGEFQRLEFLGDRVLGLTIAHTLYTAFTKKTEGDLAKVLGYLVSKEACDHVAMELGLEDFLIQSKERASANSAILADGVEALLGAIYLDSNFETCQKVVKHLWQNLLSNGTTTLPRDAKSTLQEWVQKQGLPVPTYAIIERTGPDHSPFFAIQVSLSTGEEALGYGHSKRQGEQKAAETLLATLGL